MSPSGTPRKVKNEPIKKYIEMMEKPLERQSKEVMIETIQLRNFYPFKGEHEVNLENTVILGENGVGKTTLVTKALTFLITGSAYGFKQTQYELFIDGEGHVSALFKVNGKKYWITRAVSKGRQLPLTILDLDTGEEEKIVASMSKGKITELTGLSKDNIDLWIIRSEKAYDFVHATPSERKKKLSDIIGIRAVWEKFRQEAKKKLNNKKRQLISTETILEELRGKHEQRKQMETEIASIEQRIQALRQEKNKLAKQLEEKKQQLQKLSETEKQIEEISKELQRLYSEKQVLEKETQNNKAIIENNRRQLETRLKHSIEEYVKTLGEMKKELEEITKKTEELKEQKKDLEVRRMLLKNTISQLEDQKQVLEKEIESEEQRKETLEANVSALQNQSKQKKDLYEVLEILQKKAFAMTITYQILKKLLELSESKKNIMSTQLVREATDYCELYETMLRNMNTNKHDKNNNIDKKTSTSTTEQSPNPFIQNAQDTSNATENNAGERKEISNMQKLSYDYQEIDQETMERIEADITALLTKIHGELENMEEKLKKHVDREIEQLSALMERKNEYAQYNTYRLPPELLEETGNKKIIQKQLRQYLEQLREKKEKILERQKEKTQTEQEILAKNEELEKSRKKLELVNEKLSKLLYRQKQLEKEIEQKRLVIEENKTSKQVVTEKIRLLEKQVKEKNAKQKQLEQKIAELEREKREKQEHYDPEKQEQLEFIVEGINDRLEKLSTELNQLIGRKNHLEETVNLLPTEEQVREKEAELERLRKQVVALDFLKTSVFHENGVPKYVINHYVLPTLSDVSSNYLDILTNGEMPRIEFYMDEKEMTANVYKDGETRDASSFSTGEKARIALSINLGLVEILRSTGLDIRTLVIDEAGIGNIDREDRAEIGKLFTYLTKETNTFTNIVVITHNYEVASNFENAKTYVFERPGVFVEAEPTIIEEIKTQ